MTILASRQSVVINIMKGLLPILVVILHTSFDASLCWRNGVEPFIRVLITKLGGIAVPAFFLISGYLFFSKLDKWDWTIWLKKMKTRVSTLLIPFLLWIILDFAAKYIWGIAKGDIGGFSVSSIWDFFCHSGSLRIFWDRPHHTYSINLLGWTLDTSKPINAPMWYVRDLMMLIMVAPAIWWILKVSRYRVLAVFFLLNTFDIGFPFILFSPTAIFFFSVGAAFSMSGTDFLDKFQRFSLPSYIVAAILIIVVLILDGSMIGDAVYRLFVCAGVIACFCIVDSLYVHGRVREHRILIDSSFFVYASHAVLIMEISNFILWRLMPATTTWILVLKVFLRPIVTICICISLYIVMKKHVPRTLALLTGGRG